MKEAKRQEKRKEEIYLNYSTMGLQLLFDAPEVIKWSKSVKSYI